ncbi:ABC transporter substrate-binding protein [Salinirubellus salinus]|uniref:ABC transporter substrate-binding protein n=1 Tax=Salinirubellus salinus TaxID=1364945 RepID=A0A9E7R193_9EURY|nr:ABC transporter substrate-binding protein [Salinirubellus salinus]UWM53819.1 ABC transporter substrate-binding protein [Salinirubellus salinus]
MPERPTRRDVIKYGGIAGGAGLLAGCTGGTTPDSAEGTATETPREATTTEPDAAAEAGYSVTMSPVGTVEFEEPPETVFTRLTHHADMAFALGKGDGINAMHAPDYYDSLWNQFVERLPGVTLDWTGLYSSWQAEKEQLYELDSDIHLADPAWVTQLDNWDRSAIEEVAENVGPWFGNSLSDRHQEPSAEWAEGYEYYGLWEQFGLVADAFRERERYEALAAVHNDLLETIEDGLPPESERPSAVMFSSADLETIYAYTLSTPGFLTAHTRPLAPRDAFEGSVESGSTVDFEALLEADPDVVLYLGGMLPTTDMATVRETLASNPVAGEMTAVAEGRVHAQGARYQGPILNLFQLEMTAKQLYPERFGAWPDYENGPYPELPTEERLFDRQRVADIVNGDG